MRRATTANDRLTCPRHPTYRAYRAPQVACEPCWIAYLDRRAKEGRTEYQQQVLKESGAFRDNSRLTAFLYLLMRDHLPTGYVSMLMAEAESVAQNGTLTNGWLGRYAQHIAKRLR